jgi:hypothetical protein
MISKFKSEGLYLRNHGPLVFCLGNASSHQKFSLRVVPETEEEGDLLNMSLEGAVEDAALRSVGTKWLYFTNELALQ